VRPSQARAHAFVADLERPDLAEDDAHHLGRVLRVRPGEVITVSDGRGGWRACRFGAELEPAGDVVRESAPDPAIAIGFAVVKGGRPEWTVQKLTELGVDTLVPFHAERSVVRWEGERAARHLERLRRVVREAAMQSRRTHLPVLDDVADLTALVRRPGAARADLGGRPPGLDRPLVLIGPEGGWSDAERALGGATVGLGPQVLRAETAAVTAAALLTSIRAGLVSNA
jgi:16S rRNA (uracil1498-N3)-methyltransferase